MSKDQIVQLVWLYGAGIYVVLVSCMLLFIYKVNDSEIDYTISHCLLLFAGIFLGPVGVVVALILFTMHIFVEYDLGDVFNKTRTFKSKSKKLKDVLDGAGNG